MNETTEKLIRELADKLGTTTEHLWGVLVRQAAIEAYSSIAILVILGVMAGVCFGVAALTWKNLIKAPNDESYIPLIFISVGVVTLVGFAMSLLANFSTILSCLFNPEYWALQQILKAL